MPSNTPPPTILALVARPLINDAGQPQARLDIESEVRQLRDRLGEANTLLALAPFSENAEEVFGIALSLYESIGDQYSLARGLFYYAKFLASQGQTDKAIAALEQCRDKFLVINLTDQAAAAQKAINELSSQ
jgi:hypothetical protein